MIKKRFIYDGLHIRDILNEIPPILTHTDNQRDEFLNGLNNLYKENEQLKQENQELRHFKLSIKAFAECNDNINRRTLNDLIGGIDYD